MMWIMVHPKATPEMLGFIPSFLSEDDPRSAREQLDANYGLVAGVLSRGSRCPQTVIFSILKTHQQGYWHRLNYEMKSFGFTNMPGCLSHSQMAVTKSVVWTKGGG